jgi:hypothetical protein
MRIWFSSDSVVLMISRGKADCRYGSDSVGVAVDTLLQLDSGYEPKTTFGKAEWNRDRPNSDVIVIFLIFVGSRKQNPSPPPTTRLVTMATPDTYYPRYPPPSSIS